MPLKIMGYACRTHAHHLPLLTPDWTLISLCQLEHFFSYWKNMGKTILYIRSNLSNLLLHRITSHVFSSDCISGMQTKHYVDSTSPYNISRCCLPSPLLIFPSLCSSRMPTQYCSPCGETYQPCILQTPSSYSSREHSSCSVSGV